MPRIDVPADRDPLVYLWTERAPGLTATAGAFSDAVYRKSTLPIRELEAARIRIAQINDCTLCLGWRTARDVPDRAANLGDDGRPVEVRRLGGTRLAEAAHREQLAQVGRGIDLEGRHVARPAVHAAQAGGLLRRDPAVLPLVGLLEQRQRDAVHLVDQRRVDPVPGDHQEARFAARRVDRRGHPPPGGGVTGAGLGQVDDRDVLVGHDRRVSPRSGPGDCSDVSGM